MVVEEEVQTLPQYRSVSPVAILALVLGLASPLALVNPTLLAIPLAGVVVAVVAMRRIDANAELLSGKGMALVALFLAVFFLVYTPARMWTRFQVLKGHATQLSDALVELLHEGKTYEAHQLSQLKLAAPDPSREISTELTGEDLRRFKELEIIRKIESLDRKFSYRLDGFESTPGSRSADLLSARYVMMPDPSTRRDSFPLWVVMSRQVDDRTGKVYWKITNVSHVNPYASQ